MSLSANPTASIRLSEYVHLEAPKALFGSVLYMNVHVILVQKKKSGPNGFFVFGSTNTIPGFQKFEIFSSRYFEKIQEFTKDR